MKDHELIQSLGGATKVAEMLGYDKHGVQRVHNWIKRGIPASVKVEFPHIFMPDAIKPSRRAKMGHKEPAHV